MKLSEELLKNVTLSAEEKDSELLLAPSYVAVIVVVIVVLLLVVGGVMIYKVHHTWHSRKTERRHSSRNWLVEDNPDIWTEGSFDVTKDDKHKLKIKINPKPAHRPHMHRPSLSE